MFSLPNPERVELLDISNTKMKSPNLKRYTALKELYANGISATSLDLKKMSKIRVHLFERYEIFEKVGSFEAEAFDQCRI